MTEDDCVARSERMVIEWPEVVPGASTTALVYGSVVFDAPTLDYVYRLEKKHWWSRPRWTNYKL